MEHIDCPLELKAAPSADGTFTGYLSTFDNTDLQGDVIAPGAFRASLAEHRAAGTRVKLLWQHDTREPIGVWDDLKEDAKGLLGKGRLFLDVQRAKEAMTLLKGRAVDALSIGFRTLEKEDGKDGTRRLTKLQLFEGSLVTFPANPMALVTTVKQEFAAGDVPSPRDIEHCCRHMGMSRNQARQFMSKGFAGIDQRPDDDEFDEVLAAVASRIADLGRMRRSLRH